MKKIDVETYKIILLQILSEIDAYCNRKGLTYFIDSGTLLGAVRHHGYIPWDDDIDLVMPREDYEKFITGFETSTCKVLSFKSSCDYYYQYAKVNYSNSKVIEFGVSPLDCLGINIDVFPLDGMPDNKFKRRIHQDTLMIWSKIRTLMVVVRSHLPLHLRFLFPYRWTLLIIDYLGKKYKYSESCLVGNIVATTVRHKEIPKKYFSDSVYLEFEGKKYPAPKDYDKYLRKLYGDYMKLPPKDKQVSHHRFEAFIGE